MNNKMVHSSEFVIVVAQPSTLRRIVAAKKRTTLPSLKHLGQRKSRSFFLFIDRLIAV